MMVYFITLSIIEKYRGLWSFLCRCILTPHHLSHLFLSLNTFPAARTLCCIYHPAGFSSSIWSLGTENKLQYKFCSAKPGLLSPARFSSLCAAIFSFSWRTLTNWSWRCPCTHDRDAKFSRCYHSIPTGVFCFLTTKISVNSDSWN